jgi:2-oxoglutarate dehydrogenase complex dehydrogenase (E1) component-like enzyme
MYNIIKNMQPVRNKYRQTLIASGIPEEKILEIEKVADDENEAAYIKSKNFEFKKEEWASEQWEKIKDPQIYGKFKDTGVDIKALRTIGQKICLLPSEKKFHPQVEKIF